MTPNEKLRIAVAEADGWSLHQVKVLGMEDVAILPPGVSISDEGSLWRYAGTTLPDYTADRNVIIGAIERMSEHERDKLAWILFEWAADCEGDAGPHECLKILTAEPETLCRLYLKAKGIDFEES